MQLGNPYLSDSRDGAGEVALLLVKAGADLTAKNNEGIILLVLNHWTLGIGCFLVKSPKMNYKNVLNKDENLQNLNLESYWI